MSQPPKTDLAVVKTSDLIYVFCAAAWVNVLTSTFGNGANWPCYLLAFLTFALIPLELYTSSLWQQAVFIVKKEPDDDALQQSLLATVDIFRLFALTMAFILLFIPLSLFIKPHGEVKGDASTEAYVIFIAIFLSANWLWNQILFKGKFRINKTNRPDHYRAILRRYREVMRLDNQALDDLRSEPIYNTITHAFSGQVTFTLCFGAFNRFLFERFFFWVFMGLYLIAALGFTFDIMHQFLVSIIGWLSIGIFGLQIGAKLTQIIFFSIVVSAIRGAEVKQTARVQAQAAGVRR